MKALFFALAACITQVQAQPADIYIVAGQSNGWRLSKVSALPGKGAHTVHYFGMGCTTRPDTAQHTFIENVNPQSSGGGLASALLDHSGRDIVFIQYCVCGSSLDGIDDWQPGEPGKPNDAGIYASFTRYLADARRQVEALGIEWKVKALFWHQGESDVKQTTARHRQNLTHLLARFRQDFGAGLPVVAGHIRELEDGSRGINAALDAVAAADPRFTVVPSNDLEFESPTNVHIKPVGCVVLGQRMVAALKKMEAEPRP
jgi:hypothetical protein